jgi:hypothetical protein
MLPSIKVKRVYHRLVQECKPLFQIFQPRRVPETGTVEAVLLDSVLVGDLDQRFPLRQNVAEVTGDFLKRGEGIKQLEET